MDQKTDNGALCILVSLVSACHFLAVDIACLATIRIHLDL